ncbi:hypothetical protein J2Y41_003931 [Arthrobacter sp. 1088]|nr:hypothetical protein [Arthrobacter sp. 1088]
MFVWAALVSPPKTKIVTPLEVVTGTVTAGLLLSGAITPAFGADGQRTPMFLFLYGPAAPVDSIGPVLGREYRVWADSAPAESHPQEIVTDFRRETRGLRP